MPIGGRSASCEPAHDRHVPEVERLVVPCQQGTPHLSGHVVLVVVLRRTAGRTRVRRFIVVILAVGLAATACNRGDDATTETTLVATSIGSASDGVVTSAGWYHCQHPRFGRRHDRGYDDCDRHRYADL